MLPASFWSICEPVVSSASQISSGSDQLHYVLSFPRGEQGWTADIQLRKKKQKKEVAIGS